MTKSLKKAPRSAAWLGALGALPFMGLACATPLLSGSMKIFAAHALVAYGAVILSFLGGVHWGLAIADERRADDVGLAARLVASVIPSLAGWAALLIERQIALIILAAAFAAMLWVDLRATRAGEAPSWYPTLRIPLSLVAIAALLLGAAT